MPIERYIYKRQTKEFNFFQRAAAYIMMIDVF